MRTITVILTDKQQQVVVEGEFKTLNDLTEALNKAGVTTEGYTFTERNTKASFVEGDAQLPSSVVNRQGETTEHLLMTAAITNHKFKNGAMSRKEILEQIKERGLANKVRMAEGKSYTNVSSDKLLVYLKEAEVGNNNPEEVMRRVQLSLTYSNEEYDKKIALLAILVKECLTHLYNDEFPLSEIAEAYIKGMNHCECKEKKETIKSPYSQEEIDALLQD